MRGASLTANQETNGAASEAVAAAPSRVPLTRREREILGLLAEGMSGAQIADKLVLSPETVRTHVRNAMAKLGASTRSQAVALALRSHEIAGDAESPDAAAAADQAPSPATESVDPTKALAHMLDGLVGLYDLDGGAVYLIEEDGFSLRRVARTAPEGESLALPEAVSLGDGALGRAALERRAQLIQSPGESNGGAMIAAPMVSGGKLQGLIALAPRISRPTGRSELLLLQAFATRVGEVLQAGADVPRRLERAMERFRASWSAATRIA